jgi:hypothetical protein
LMMKTPNDDSFISKSQTLCVVSFVTFVFFVTILIVLTKKIVESQFEIQNLNCTFFPKN